MPNSPFQVPHSTTVSVSASVSLMDFTAYELPTKKWMKLVRPRMRLRVRAQNTDFVSPVVKVSGQSSNETCFSTARWPWGEDDDARFSRPSFVDDELLEVEVERRFLFRYKCIRRTKPVTIDQVRTGDHCALSLYDRRQFSDVHGDRIEIGKITFTLRSDASSEDTWSEDEDSLGHQKARLLQEPRAAWNHRVLRADQVIAARGEGNF